ncbi:MAG: winged helix-turn-helix domain-containing protein [Ktedonobacterales bacterium]
MSQRPPAVSVSRQTTRRFILGRQGLWPGRRWAGEAGVAEALRACEAVQMDPLNVVARSHDLALMARVTDYAPAMLDRALYDRREFFDYGGGLFIYPMAELPYWRTPMRRRQGGPRWGAFATDHPALLDEMRAEVRSRGPLGNRDFAGGARVTGNYRGRKDTSIALYYLWLTGEMMIHHRRGFERVYDLRERVAPPHYDNIATEAEAEAYFARKAIAFHGLVSEKRWGALVGDFIWRRLARDEAARWLASLIADGVIARVNVEGSREGWLALAEDLPLLHTLEACEVPATWRPLATTTAEEVVALAPLEIVSARGRAAWLFDFEYIWEVYKPAQARRWGYYTLPILAGDTLVARFDPRLDRGASTLRVNGFWREAGAIADEAAFTEALARGLIRFARTLGARRIDLAALTPAADWTALARRLGDALAEDA